MLTKSICAVLADTINIHRGRGDLVFPHYKNKIAQVEAIATKRLCQILDAQWYG
jgi:cysteinyl-tRNA synthetase